jgi:hypothetical protein
MAETNIPNAKEKINLREKDVPWYSESIDSKITPQARQLLEEYSHIPPAEVEDHVLSIVSALAIYYYFQYIT